ncbi:DUF1697 domain-containing protein [Mariniflexile litorale]|uniref:DUF1697 domain-containing protein n=1 Tax=Mariniflexile litorale TaxID=3045158 RepID=A0AAU7EBF3_9FLAO|nr:DUF1697 domain-containing protein [Mariniflexile sp. KMM 9835]MDQ8210514.1 DUF1697 domain-containing protein [Mariniflexile sp. KMM 9835]
MNTCIAFLRGINVGGHKKVPMAELRDLLTGAGFQNVQTYIQSGNVIFQSLEKTSELETKIKKRMHSYFGFEVPVIVKTNSELQTIFDACPFSEEKKETSYFIFLSDIPNENLIKKAQEITYENEEVIIKKDCLYFYSSTGYGKTKFNMNTYERKLKVVGTSRNYKTMVKLLSLSLDLI